MNTKIVDKTKVESLPKFPELKSTNTNIVVTKHFTNLSFWLSKEELSLVNWLICRMAADNTFVHSTQSLRLFGASIRAAQREYGANISTNSSLIYTRRWFVSLIKQGIIFTTPWRNVFMINPMLSYSADVVNRSNYNNLQERYQTLVPEDIDSFVREYVDYVRQFLSAKKKNYIYGRDRV